MNIASDEPEFISLPDDFQSMRRVRLSSVTGKPRLEFMSQTQIEDYRYRIDDIPRQPCHFSIVGTEMELAPTPNDSYTLEMVYRANIPALTPDNPTNWLLSLAPDVYVYGALLETAPYTKNDARIPVWAGALSQVVDQLNTHGERLSVNPGPSSISLPGVTP